MARSITALAKALTRSAALEDLRFTLPAARFAIDLLYLGAADAAGRELADAARRALDDAAALVRRLR